MLSLWLARLWESWNLQPQSLSLPGHGSLQKICEQSSGERSFSRCLDETVGFVTAQVKGRVLSPLGRKTIFNSLPVVSRAGLIVQIFLWREAHVF